MLIHPIKVPAIDWDLIAGRTAQAMFFFGLAVVCIGEALFVELPRHLKITKERHL